MSKPTQDGTDTDPSKTKGKRTAYLIAVHQRRETVRVYAVLADKAETALAQVRVLATDAMEVEVVGALSRNLARQLGLKPGDTLLV